jgi:hypothetical protein
MSRGLVFQLTRRHEVLHACPKLMALTAVSGTLVVNVLTFRAAQTGDPVGFGAVDGLLLQAVILVGFAGILFKSVAARRCRPWEAALPVSSFVLWRSHHLALIASGLLSMLVTGAVVAVFVATMRAVTELDLLSLKQLALLMVRPALLVMAISGAVAIRRVDLADLAADAGWPRLRALLVVALYLLLAGLSFLPLIVSIIPVFAVTIWAVSKGAQLPPVLESQPICSDAGQDVTGAVGLDEPIAASGRVASKTIQRQLFKWPATWIVGLPFILLFGVLLGGYIPGKGFSDDSMRVVQYFIVVYLLLAFSGHFMENLYRVDHLPVSRRRLLLWLTMPGLICVSLGYITSQSFLNRSQLANEQIRFVNEEENYGLKVPVEFFNLSATGDVPPIFDPQGEEAEAFSVPVMKGLPWRLWKAHTTPNGMGMEFVAWQISRAVEALYGAQIPPAEIQDRYLEIGPAGRVVVREPGLTLQADYPDLRSAYRGPVYPLLVGSICIVYLLVLGLFFSFFRAGVTIKKGRIAFWGLMVGLFALHIGVYATLIIGWTEDWILTGALLSVARSAAATGVGSQALIWFCFAVLAGLSWVWMERRFAAVEAPRG